MTCQTRLAGPLTFAVGWDATIRDSRANLIREDHDSLMTPALSSAAGAVLAIVQTYWPEAKAKDIQWSVDPRFWVGSGEVRWSTCAEIDGFVRPTGAGEQFNG